MINVNKKDSWWQIPNIILFVQLEEICSAENNCTKTEINDLLGLHQHLYKGSSTTPWNFVFDNFNISRKGVSNNSSKNHLFIYLIEISCFKKSKTFLRETTVALSIFH